MFLLQEPTFRPLYAHQFPHTAARRTKAGANPVNSIAANVRETPEAFQLHLTAPGRTKEEFKIQVSSQALLTVSYTGSQPAESWTREEFRIASFERSFKLSDSIDTTKVSASYEAGILVVTLPKLEVAQNPVLDIPVL